MASGFESNGMGACRHCGHTRVPFGFMTESCKCTGQRRHIVSSQETVAAIKRGRKKQADKATESTSADFINV